MTRLLKNSVITGITTFAIVALFMATSRPAEAQYWSYDFSYSSGYGGYYDTSYYGNYGGYYDSGYYGSYYYPSYSTYYSPTYYTGGYGYNYGNYGGYYGSPYGTPINNNYGYYNNNNNYGYGSGHGDRNDRDDRSDWGPNQGSDYDRRDGRRGERN